MDNLDKIFKAYDVRGKYPEEINEEIAYKIGKASAKILARPRNGKLIVARDNRPSSKKLLEAIINGIIDFGIDVVDVGLSTAPAFYYAVSKFRANGGIIVTASHNSENYNGFKIVKEKAMPVGIKGLNRIKKYAVKNIVDSDKKGSVETKEVSKDYIDSILKLGQGDLNPSGFSFSFDDDQDRIFFTDENNKKIDPDLISAILIHYCFKNAGRILYTAASSKIVREEAIKNGNKVILSRIGHSFMKEKMAKKKIVFGCEASGHYYFRETGYVEAPLLALMKIIEIMQQTKKSLSVLAGEFNKYFLKRIQFDIIDAQKTELQIKNIKKMYKKTAKISSFDGITIEAKNWWFNLHISNTEPVIRLTIEATAPELLAGRIKELTPFFA